MEVSGIMKIRYGFLTIILVTTIILTACAGTSNPVESGLSGNSSPDASTNGNLWGYYDVAIDTASGAVEIIPIRTAEFAANVTVFLQPPLGTTQNMGIHIVDMSDYMTTGRIDVDVTLTHPFPGLDMYTGFDVMGVFIHYWDWNSEYDTSLAWPRTSDAARLLNPDGYTRWYNPEEFLSPNILGFVDGALGTKNAGFDATLNPYKYFCDGLAGEEDLIEFMHDPGNLDNRGLFSPSVNTRRYELQFPLVSGSPVLKFQYAVVAFWEAPTGDPPLDIPEDFPIGANRPEPFLMYVTDNGSDLYHTDTEAGGTVRITAEIFDWGASQNPSGVIGEISKIVIESPDCNFDGGYIELSPEDFFANASPGTSVSSVAEVELTGFGPYWPDTADFLVTIESENPSGYDQGFDVPVPDAPLASYFFFTLPVGDTNPCEPPVLSLDATDTGIAGADIEFDATATTGTQPLTFEWDWDNDGTVDETTDTGFATHAFPPGDWQVGLRVFNACGEDTLDPPHDISITCPDEVHNTILGIVYPDGDYDDLRQDGTAFMPDGDLLVKCQDQLVMVDVTTPGNATVDVLINDLANCGYSGGMWTYIVNLDYDEVTDNIIYSVAPSPDERVTVYDNEGTFLTQFDVPNSDGVMAGLDTDADGDIWCLYHTPGGTTGTNTLYHYAWNSSDEVYVPVNGDTMDCTFVKNGIRGIYDIAIIPSLDRLYIFHSDSYPYRGCIYVIDISTSPPTRLDSLDKFQIFDWTGNAGASISDYGKWEGGSIEVDHYDSNIEGCRLIVQHSFQSGGDGIGLMKFDADLNVLDTYRRTGTRLFSLAIRPGDDVTDRLVAMPSWTHGTCNIYVFTPPTGW